MIGLMLFFILTTVALPSFSDYQHSLGLKIVVNNLLSDIRYVQGQSIITSVKHGIVFDLSNNSYSIIKNKEDPRVLERISLEEVKIKSSTLPDYYDLGSAVPALFYQELGNLDHRNGRVKLVLEGEVREIVFSSNGGEINLK
ncbi:MAG: hypothetical protein R6V17_09245 [Halanaerobacter sp.]